MSFLYNKNFCASTLEGCTYEQRIIQTFMCSHSSIYEMRRNTNFSEFLYCLVNIKNTNKSMFYRIINVFNKVRKDKDTGLLVWHLNKLEKEIS